MLKNKIHINVLFLLGLVLSFSSCIDDPTYNVDSALDGYLQRFLHEGSLRGKTFDLKEQGLILQFGDLEEDVAGRCYYEDPIRIVIDKEYWDNLANYEEYDLLRENVIFHELGHGLLNRRHINDYLENSDWKSMMCGGTVIDNRSWNINYRSIRREYYLDELFNINTTAPAWASKVFTAAVTEVALVEDEFLTAAFWPLGDTDKYTASVSGGVYSFFNKGEYGTLVVRPVQLTSTSNFYMESSIKIVDASAITQSGLLFGDANSSIRGNYCLFDNNQRMYVGNTESYGWYTELIKSSIKVNDYNVIGIRKIGSDVYYYINGQCVYYDQLTINRQGDAFGFEVPGGSTILVDYFRVYSNALKNAIPFDAKVREPKIINRSKGLWLNK